MKMKAKKKISITYKILSHMRNHIKKTKVIEGKTKKIIQASSLL